MRIRIKKSRRGKKKKNPIRRRSELGEWEWEGDGEERSGRMDKLIWEGGG